MPGRGVGDSWSLRPLPTQAILWFSNIQGIVFLRVFLCIVLLLLLLSGGLCNIVIYSMPGCESINQKLNVSSKSILEWHWEAGCLWDDWRSHCARAIRSSWVLYVVPGGLWALYLVLDWFDFFLNMKSKWMVLEHFRIMEYRYEEIIKSSKPCAISHCSHISWSWMPGHRNQ